jgi:arylsulfatase A
MLMFLLAASAQAVQPNIIMIVADDLGWADLGCYGNRFNETPNIDRLARDGVKFTQFYAMPVCSPTRASIQSGQNPARFGLTAHIPGHWKPFEKLVEPPCALAMPHDVYALPQALKDAGYATGHFGKWHLGGKGSLPGDFGYDEVF